VGIESTIVGYWKGEFRLLRPGGIALEDIEKIIGKIKVFSARSDDQIPAPGTMKKHYSPHTPMKLGDKGTLLSHCNKFGRLVFGEHSYQDTPHIENLSIKGDLSEAASRLYHLMRKLDKLNLQEILADRLPETGLGLAINDRLERAASS